MKPFSNREETNRSSLSHTATAPSAESNVQAEQHTLRRDHGIEFPSPPCIISYVGIHTGPTMSGNLVADDGSVIPTMTELPPNAGSAETYPAYSHTVTPHEDVETVYTEVYTDFANNNASPGLVESSDMAARAHQPEAMVYS